MNPAGRSPRIILTLWLLALLSPSLAAASDSKDLALMLRQFLDAAHERAAHEGFWAEDLVYTSSNGTRFGKAEILAGFAVEKSPGDPPPVAYAAEDVDVRVFGAAAVVTFRLIGTPADGSPLLRYYNTGAFLKRNDAWQVVAWQATVIPDASESAPPEEH